MDFHLPDLSGPVAAARIQARFQELQSSSTAPRVRRALLDAIDAGATVYLTKAATGGRDHRSIRRASIGEVLIPVALFAKAVARQRQGIADVKAPEIVREIHTARARGATSAGPGRRYNNGGPPNGYCCSTVEWHVHHVIEKLGVDSKLQAVIAAARMGLIEM